jgi:MFS family permease
MIKTENRFSELQSHFGLLTACFAGMMLGVAAIPFYTLGIFAGPVTAATGWSMQQYQTAFTFIIVGTLVGPFVGHLCDRFGAKPVALVSIVAFAIALACLGPAAETGLYSFYAAWAVMAIVGQGTGPVIWTHIVGHNFEQNRGLAFGIVLAGSGVFAIFGPALVNIVMAQWGWAAGYTFLAILVLCIPLPLAAVLLRSSSAKPTTADVVLRTGPENEGLTLRQALGNFRLYIIGIAFFVIAFGVAGLISNMIPMMQTGGISAADGGRLIGLVGVAVIAGRLVMGAMLDRFWAPAVAAIVMLCPAFACLILLSGISETNAAIAILFIGFAAGAEFDIVAFLASAYFGLKAYGKIYGILYVALFIGAAIAPPLFGWAYDVEGSYRSILLIVAIVVPAAAISLLTLGRYPQFSDPLSGK